jgi:hypothetical protein
MLETQGRLNLITKDQKALLTPAQEQQMVKLINWVHDWVQILYIYQTLLEWQKTNEIILPPIQTTCG